MPNGVRQLLYVLDFLYEFYFKSVNFFWSVAKITFYENDVKIWLKIAEKIWIKHIFPQIYTGDALQVTNIIYLGLGNYNPANIYWFIKISKKIHTMNLIFDVIDWGRSCFMYLCITDLGIFIFFREMSNNMLINCQLTSIITQIIDFK